MEVAEEIGQLIQNDEVCKNLKAAYGESKEDKELQNLLRQLSTKDGCLVSYDECNEEEKDVYLKIFSNANMIKCQKAEKEFGKFINKVMSTIVDCAQGREFALDSEFDDDGCQSDCSNCCSECH
jgi:hypothetical protein